MSLEIAERERENVVILALKGRITMSEVTPVRDKVSELIAAAHSQIVLDLGDVDSFAMTWARLLINDVDAWRDELERRRIIRGP